MSAAPDADPPREIDPEPVRYIERTRAWYDALGTDNRYRWAAHVDVPFVRPARPIARARVALLTTAAPYRPELGAQGAGAPYNAAAKFYAIWSADSTAELDLRISHVAIDRRQQTDDARCWFPMRALRRAETAGRVGAIADRVHGVPTNRSQRHTAEVDAPEVLARCRADGVEAAILVANCPVCHQSTALVGRHLEAAGIPTVLMGTARDIVERCGVPRFVFSDLPLGNAAALPDDPASGDVNLALALDLLEHAFAPRTTVRSPLRWTRAPDWKRHVLDVGALTPDAIARLRAEHAESLRVGRAVRDATPNGAG